MTVTRHRKLLNADEIKVRDFNEVTINLKWMVNLAYKLANKHNFSDKLRNNIEVIQNLLEEWIGDFYEEKGDDKCI